ncbi:hypothetical protein DW690_26605 [Dorea longicatena]|nr:hypothetical protein DW690_26605 [Dorea longicatena]
MYLHRLFKQDDDIQQNNFFWSFSQPIPRTLYNQWKRSFLTAVILLAVFWLCVYLMKMGADDPFLYFRF